jgi:hypothetical protein
MSADAAELAGSASIKVALFAIASALAGRAVSPAE